MNLLEKIIQVYPTLSLEDIGLKDEGNGVEISYWNSKEPKPTNEQVRQLEIEVLDYQKQNPPKTEIELLMEENLDLKLALAEIAESQQSDKTEIQLALAEMAEALLGGE